MKNTAGKCSVCGSDSFPQEDFCQIHLRGLRELRVGYDVWNRAYGKLSLEDYLARLSGLSETGEEVKKIVQYFQHHPEKWVKT